MAHDSGNKAGVMSFTSLMAGLDSFAGTGRPVEKELPPVPGLENPSKLSEGLQRKWTAAAKRYEEVLARSKK